MTPQETYRKKHLPKYADFVRKYRAKNKKKLELWKLHVEGNMSCPEFKRLSKLV